MYSTGGHLSGDQFERLKSELESSFQGARILLARRRHDAGRPLLLEGGLDWHFAWSLRGEPDATAMSMTPRDMDFLEAKHTAAREIALAIEVPPILLGMHI